MSKARIQKQQGDVTFERVDAMPTSGTVLTASARGYVLAEGEVTGHAHVIDPNAVLELREVDGVLYARIGEPTEVRHEEHGPVVLEPGTWRVNRVQEYDHFAEEARTIAD